VSTSFWQYQLNKFLAVPAQQVSGSTSSTSFWQYQLNKFLAVPAFSWDVPCIPCIPCIHVQSWVVFCCATSLPAAASCWFADWSCVVLLPFAPFAPLQVPEDGGP
jgi:hypothetical protein